MRSMLAYESSGARRTARALAVALVLVAALPSVASACGDFRKSAAHARPPGGGLAPLIVGDSTMIFATPVLGRLGLEADAHGCRQYVQGVGILSARRRGGGLPRLAILALGANGPVSVGQIDATLRSIGGDHILGLVTPRNSAGTANAMRAAARRHPDRVLLADWAASSAPHGSWFAGDGLHVNQTGANAFARLVRRTAQPFFIPAGLRERVTRAIARAGGDCGTVRRFGRRLRVRTIRGASIVPCAQLRAVARRPPLHRRRDWHAYDGPAARLAGVADVLVRNDGRAVAVTRPIS